MSNEAPAPPHPEEPQPDTSPEAQAAWVELMLTNERGHYHNLLSLVEKQRRPKDEAEFVGRRLPAGEAAARTMRRWADSKKPK